MFSKSSCVRPATVSSSAKVTRTTSPRPSQVCDGALRLLYAQANLQTSIATYRQVIGVQPTRLEPARRLRVFFRTRLAARSTLRLPNIPKFKRQCMPWTRRPLQVKLVEGKLAPTVNSRRNVSKL